MRTITILLVASLSSTSAFARPMTCEQLKNELEGKSSGLSIDPGAELMGVAATRREFCIPAGLTLGVLRAIFIHWADGNPKLAAMPSWDCVAKAFGEAFPCPKNSN